MMFVLRIWDRSCVGVCFACGKILNSLLIQGDTLASTGSLGGASLSILLQAKCDCPFARPAQPVVNAWKHQVKNQEIAFHIPW